MAHDVAAVTAAHARVAKVKVIFENAYLKDEHKRAAVSDLRRGTGQALGEDESTGYAETGATVEDLS